MDAQLVELDNPDHNQVWLLAAPAAPVVAEIVPAAPLAPLVDEQDMGVPSAQGSGGTLWGTPLPTPPDAPQPTAAPRPTAALTFDPAHAGPGGSSGGSTWGHDRLSRLEKSTLLALGAGNAFNILLFAMGLTLSDATGGPWLWVRGAFAVIQFVAFDLTVVATVQAMRDGRRSRWAGLTVAVAALAAILIALDVSTWRMPFVHAAYAVVLPLFMLHLAAVRQGVTHELQGVARRASAAEQEVAELRDGVGKIKALPQITFSLGYSF